MSNISIEEIIIEKKPRKPRMSKIVEKAILLKQLSESDLIPTDAKAPPVGDDKVATRERKVKAVKILDTPVDGTSRVVEATAESGRSKPVPTRASASASASKKKLKPVPLVESVKAHSTTGGTVSKPTFTCTLCDITFTSEILFNRHPQTIKHKIALEKIV